MDKSAALMLDKSTFSFVDDLNGPVWKKGASLEERAEDGAAEELAENAPKTERGVFVPQMECRRGGVFVPQMERTPKEQFRWNYFSAPFLTWTKKNQTKKGVDGTQVGDLDLRKIVGTYSKEDSAAGVGLVSWVDGRKPAARDSSQA